MAPSSPGSLDELEAALAEERARRRQAELELERLRAELEALRGLSPGAGEQAGGELGELRWRVAELEEERDAALLEVEAAVQEREALRRSRDEIQASASYRVGRRLVGGMRSLGGLRKKPGQT